MKGRYMSEDATAESAWIIYEAYGPGAVAYWEGQAQDAAARGDMAMETWYLNLAKLAGEIRDPENPS
jgi:hypothetical protein